MKSRNSIGCLLISVSLLAVSIYLFFYKPSFTEFAILLCVIGLIGFVIGVVELKIISSIRKKKMGELELGEKPQYNYEKKKSIMSKPERIFLSIIEKSVNKNYKVLSQVALNTVIDKRDCAFRSELSRIVDFCIVDCKNYKPRLLIELNDKSHQKPDRLLRDKKVAEICKKAKIKLISFQLDDLQHKARIKRKIKWHIMLSKF